MKPLAMIAATVVTLALISYSIGIITEQRRRKVIPRVLTFLSLGVSLDITATVMMIIVSENSMFTLHGLMGYTALLLMLVDAVLLWGHRFIKGLDEPVSRSLHLYSRTAYLLWVAAYISGSLMAFL